MKPQKPTGKLHQLPGRPLIKEGVYPGLIKSWDVHKQFGSDKLLLHVSINTNTETIDLTYFANIKRDEHGEINAPTSTTSFAKLLKNLFPGSKFEDINLNDLIDMSCMASVVTVGTDFCRQPLSTEKRYSKIKDIGRHKAEDISSPAYEDDIPF
jgi:hypothetical protein